MVKKDCETKQGNEEPLHLLEVERISSEIYHQPQGDS